MGDSLTTAVLVFAAATAVVAVSGTWLTRVSDQLADKTGLGEAFVGTLLLAGATSIPDFAATISAAVSDRPRLAMSHLMGSIALNMVFLGAADVVYRKANLEHAAASAANLIQGLLLIALLVLPLLARAAPSVELAGVHPVSPLLLLGYLGGLRLVRSAHKRPMWSPLRTPQTVKESDAPGFVAARLGTLWFRFAALTAVTGLSGWILMGCTRVIADRTGLAETLAGGLLTAFATSTPELVTTIAAVRRGALTLAVSNIIGTNCFNTLAIAGADVGYRRGSIYHAIPATELVWGLVSILMTTVLLLGMVRRQTYGPGRVGFETVLMLLVYAAGVAVMIASA